eukprot:s2050_g4.t1
MLALIFTDLETVCEIFSQMFGRLELFGAANATALISWERLVLPRPRGQDIPVGLFECTWVTSETPQHMSWAGHKLGYHTEIPPQKGTSGETWLPEKICSDEKKQMRVAASACAGAGGDGLG